jgi:hypothetical protein
MFIDPGTQRILKLRRSETFAWQKGHCAPPELKRSFGYLSYKHSAALRPGSVNGISVKVTRRAARIGLERKRPRLLKPWRPRRSRSSLKRLGRFLMRGVTRLNERWARSDWESKQSSPYAIVSIIVSANSFVVALPPMSRVRTLPSSKTLSIAASIFSAASRSSM